MAGHPPTGHQRPGANIMSEVPAAVEQGYTAEEAAAFASMADALARFGNAIDECAAVGITLPAALAACGVPLPGWAAAFVATMPKPAPTPDGNPAGDAG